MANQSLEVQQKKELVAKGEKTVPARYYVPSTDIYETAEALKVVMEVPGVDRKNIDIKLEDDQLRVDARIDFASYDGMEPLYTEYNVGHFARSFSLSHLIDQKSIQASLDDGVLTITLKKVEQAQPRKIEIR
jgi:HSP20 family molecular chaperone IbpA